MRLSFFVLALLFVPLVLSAQKAYSPNGGTFTPSGKLRALLVLVRFKDGAPANPKFSNAEQKLGGWNSYWPDAADTAAGALRNFLFVDTSDFENPLYMQGRENTSTSRILYDMSKPQRDFRFMGEIFRDKQGQPQVIEIDPTGARSWQELNRLAAEAMQPLADSSLLARFDQRRNRPNFKSDNSQSAPDGLLDYVIFLYRYHKNWRWGQEPVPNMHRWIGSGGGFASIGGAAAVRLDGMGMREGFTMGYGGDVFLHELAHVLYNIPHFFGANRTVGEYFYQFFCGLGATNNVPIFRGLSAWERWYMGFIEPQEPDSMQGKYRFRLKDFYTTGDALRIPLPYSDGQYLWLENHQRFHALDGHPWAGKVIGSDTLADSAPGVYAYVEAVASERSQIIRALSDKCNGLRLLNAAGHFDYRRSEKLALKNAWGNKLYNFERLAPNPISGTHPWLMYRDDFDGDGLITVDRNYNYGQNEGEGLAREMVNDSQYLNLYHNFGLYDARKAAGYTRSPAFQDGDVLDMASNPIVTSYPKYWIRKKQLGPLVLSGLRLTFEQANNGDMWVELRYAYPHIERDVRWAGNIRLENLSEDSSADLQIEEKQRLYLVESGTANRATPAESGRFINPTQLRLGAYTRVHLKPRARLIVGPNSQLQLHETAELVLEKGARIIVEKGGWLEAKDEQIKLDKRAKLIWR